MRKLSGLLCMLLLAAAAGAQTDMALPAGTAFKVKLEKTLSTFSSKEGDAFAGQGDAGRSARWKDRNSGRSHGAGTSHKSQ